MEKVKVKGSPQYRMKVVAHRPVRQMFIYLLLMASVIALVWVSYWFATYRAAQTMLTPDQATQLRAESAQLKTQVEDLRQQVVKYEMTLDVDRQASNDIRQQALLQRQKIDALKRDIAVYRMMTSKKNNNPMGIGFGIFSVVPQLVDGAAGSLYKLRLTVQKLAEGETEFSGKLQFLVVGTRAGKEEKIPLYQLVEPDETGATLTEEIPVKFKFFQKIEAQLHLPDDFSPVRVELQVAADANPKAVIAEAQLSWPETK
jgi:cell division protein FtsB